MDTSLQSNALGSRTIPHDSPPLPVSYQVVTLMRKLLANTLRVSSLLCMKGELVN